MEKSLDLLPTEEIEEILYAKELRKEEVQYIIDNCSDSLLLITTLLFTQKLSSEQLQSISNKTPSISKNTMKRWIGGNTYYKEGKDALLEFFGKIDDNGFIYFTGSNNYWSGVDSRWMYAINFGENVKELERVEGITFKRYRVRFEDIIYSVPYRKGLELLVRDNKCYEIYYRRNDYRK